VVLLGAALVTSPGDKSVVSKAGEVYDAPAGAPNRRFRLREASGCVISDDRPHNQKNLLGGRVP
jgi:hypothetical protein